MNMLKFKTALLSAGLLIGSAASAQISNQNPNKFLGNITTLYNWQESCDISDCNGNYKFTDYWQQITCENNTKWGSVHTGWGKFDWTGADRTFNYCQQHGILFKFHALIWGSQHPTWIENLSVADTKKAIIEWFDEVKKHYPDLQIIDVVNEAIYSGGDYHSPYKQTKIIQALGSLAEDRLKQTFNCNTNGYPNQNSYQWIAEAFRLARDRWPNAVLIYNDYNTFEWQKTEFINLVNGLKACGAPIDAAGCQSHDLNDMSGSKFRTALYEIHDKIQLPIYITEYDIAHSNDATQKTRYEEQFPVMWEADFVPGVTLWGWEYGKTWTTDGNSGLVKNCQKRPALTWLEGYMKTDAAKNAKAPTMGGTSVSITLPASIENGSTIELAASTNAENISHIHYSVDGEEIVDKWVAPYKHEWKVNLSSGEHTISIVVYNDKYEEVAKTEKTFTVCAARSPFKGIINIPGTIQVENFDEGCADITWHDSDDIDEGAAEEGVTAYRQTGVDVVLVEKNNYGIGYTMADEWVEFSVNVKKAGSYTYEARVASGSENSGFHLEIGGKAITKKIVVPQTPDSWSNYSVETGDLTVDLSEGQQIIRLVIDGSYCNIDYVALKQKGSTDEPEEPEDPEEPQAGVINLSKGWNLIGCPLSGSTEISSALSSIWNVVEVVKDNEAFYLKSGDAKFNSLKNVEFGRGYLVKVSEDCQLDWIAR